MDAIAEFVKAMENIAVAREVGVPNDAARVTFRLEFCTVPDQLAFDNVLTDYYIHHIRCVNPEKGLSREEALQRAMAILNCEYGRRGGSIEGAFQDALHGARGGVSAVLNALADGVQRECLTAYVRARFEACLEATDAKERASVVRRIMDRLGDQSMGS